MDNDESCRDNWEKAMKIKKNTRNAEPGDTVNALGITCIIGEIYFQDFYPSDRNDGTCDWEIEFVDTNGDYRHWKQAFDGGCITFQKKE